MSVQDLIAAASAKYNVPLSLLSAVARTESAMNPSAVSPKGAAGIMQLMPGTAADLGVTDRFDPAQNIDAGTRYLRQQFDRFGDWPKALQAYNAGPSRVQSGAASRIPETRAYVDKVMGPQAVSAAQSGADIFGMDGPAAPAAQAQSGADIFADQPAPPKPARPASLPPPAPPKAVGVGEDVARSGWGSAVRSGLGMLEQGGRAFGLTPSMASPFPGVFGALQQLFPHSLPAQLMAHPGDAASIVPGGGYQARTLPGKITQAVVPFLPAFAAPGSLAARTANVVAPAAGSEIAGQLTKGTPFEGPARTIGGMLGSVAASTRVSAAPKGPIPNADALGAAKEAAYKAADQAGVQYTPQAFGNLVTDIEQGAADSRLNPIRHAKAQSMLEEIQGLRDQGYSPTLTQLDQLRQVVRRDVANANDGGEAHFGRNMIGSIDRFVDGAGPSDVVAGNASDAASLITKARSLNTQFRKLDGLDEALGRGDRLASASNSGGNIDNATRTKVRAWYEQNKKFLTPAEDAAALKTIHGGPVQNLLRQLGKMSPQGNGLMAMLDIMSTLGGGAVGGVPGAVAAATPAMVGFPSKLAANAMTAGNVNGLRATIAGVPAPAPPQVGLLQSAPSAAALAGLLAAPALATAKPTRKSKPARH